jgi:ankyrin repeat protein
MFIQIRRFLATLIDLFLIELIVSIMMVLDVFNYDWLGSYSQDSFIAVTYFFFIFPIIPVFFVNFILELTPLHASVGKLLLGIKVVGGNHAKINPKQLFIRNVLKYGFVAFLYVALSFILTLNMYITHDHFFVTIAVFVVIYLVNNFSITSNKMIEPLLDTCIVKQSTVSVLYLPLMIIKTLVFTFALFLFPMVLMTASLVFNPNARLNTEMQNGLSFEDTTRTIDFWIKQGFDFNTTSTPIILDASLRLISGLNSAGLVNKSLSDTWNENKSKQTIFHAIFKLSEVEIKRYVNWISRHSDLQHYVLLSVCFEEVFKVNGQQPLSWKEDNGNYIFNINNRFGKDLNTALHTAVLNEAEETVRYIVKRHDADLTVRNRGGKTALDIANERINLRLIKLLGGGVSLELEVFDLIRNEAFDIAVNVLKNNPQLSIDYTDVNNHNKTALMWSLSSSSDINNELIDILVDRGTDLNPIDAKGKDVFAYAIEKGSQHTIKRLVDKGVNINQPLIDGLTALEHQLLYVGDDDVIQLLIDLGATHSLHSAILMNAYGMIDQLLKNADVNGLKANKSPIELAIECRAVDVVRKLLEAGANVNTVDSSGISLIHHAIDDDQVDIVELLVMYDVDVSGDMFSHSAVEYAKKKRNTTSPNNDDSLEKINAIIEILSKDNDEAVFELIDYIHSQDLDGVKRRIVVGDNIHRSNNDISIIATAIRLYLETQDRDLTIIKFLFENGVKIDDVYNDLKLILKSGDKPLMNLLLMQGYDTKRTIRRGSQILYSLRLRNYEMVDWLIQSGGVIKTDDIFHLVDLYPKAYINYINNGNRIDVNVTNSRGIPLIFAIVKSDNLELFELMKNSGEIAWNKKNDMGVPLLFFANSDAFVDRIIACGADPLVVSGSGKTLLHHAAKKKLNGTVERYMSHNELRNSIDDNGHTPLVTAIKTGNITASKMLVDAGVDVKTFSKKGKPTIYFAFESSCELPFIEQMISMGADVHWADEYGNTILHYIFTDHTIRILNQVGFDLNAINEVKQTAFQYNLQKNLYQRYRFIGLATTFNLVINTVDHEGKTPLIDMIADQDAQTCYDLINLGALFNIEGGRSVNIETANDGFSLWYENENGLINNVYITDITLPLLVYYASIGNLKAVQEEMIRYRQRDQAIDYHEKSGYTPLIIASSRGYKPVVAYLLSQGASIDYQIDGGISALYSASLNGHADIVQLLLTHNASIEIRNTSGLVPLHAAAENGHLNAVKVLLENDAMVNQQDNYGFSPLHIVALNKQLLICEHLLSSGATIDLETDDGRTALDLISGGRFDAKIVNLLISKGARQNPRFLINAVNEDDLLSLTNLVESGYDVNLQDKKYGTTPLHWAALHGRNAMINYLIDSGADMSVKTNDSDTALDVAKREGLKETIMLLETRMNGDQ